ncbi:hypothetical protein LCGC14_3096510, partial [marine sediment metagenome]
PEPREIPGDEGHHQRGYVATDDGHYQLHDGSIVIASITSCTNTSNPYVMIGAGLVARKARALGLDRKPWVKTSLAPGSQVVSAYLEAAELQDDLDAIGFNLVGYGCTTCIGNSGPLPEPISKAVHDNDLVVCSVLSGNRNFEGRISPDALGTDQAAELDFSGIDRIVMVACGTAFYACLTAKYWFEQLAGIPVEVDIASEFRYREPPIPRNTLAIFVSQSGETADTLAALRYCAGRARIASVVNVPESSIARESDIALPIFAGVEIGVASTKAFTCQIVVETLMALMLGRRRFMSQSKLQQYIEALGEIPEKTRSILQQSDRIRDIVDETVDHDNWLFLGRGYNYP